MADALKFHPLAEIFPLLEGPEFDALVDDIRAHELQNPITMFEGKILDGRNRFRACEIAGKEPFFDDYSGNDPLSFVVSQNIARRHLSQGQRDAIGAEIASLPAYRPGKSTPPGGLTQDEAAKQLRVSVRGIQRAAVVRDKAIPEIFDALKRGKVRTAPAAEIALLPIETQEEIFRNSASPEDYEKNLEREKKTAKREATFKRIQAEAQATPDWPDGKYSVFYADPAWEDDYGHTKRDVEHHYPTMPLDEIKALPVSEIATDDAVLYLWAVPHMVHKALDVMAHWGFEYRTQIIWGKTQIGLGAWVRNKHEVLLIGRRGEFPPPPEDRRPASLIVLPAGKHSAKPEGFAEMIEGFYPDALKIELFRRGPARPGWGAWGLEAKAEEAA